MSKELAAAIDTVFRAAPVSGFYTAVNGQLSYGRTPPESQYPYAVFAFPIRTADSTFSQLITIATVQIFMFSNQVNSAYQAWDLLDKALTAFNKKQLSPTSHNRTKLLLQSIFDPIPDSDLDGAPWRAGIEFQCRLEKTS
jgi:hypothetical protein